MTHKTRTREQATFLKNVELGEDYDVVTETSNAVRIALLSGLTYCNFTHVVVDLTDDYLACCQDWLADKAIELKKDIKWYE